MKVPAGEIAVLGEKENRMKGREEFHLQSQHSFLELGLVHGLSGLHNRSHFITFTKKGADFGADLRQECLKSKGFP